MACPAVALAQADGGGILETSNKKTTGTKFFIIYLSLKKHPAIAGRGIFFYANYFLSTLAGCASFVSTGAGCSVVAGASVVSNSLRRPD